MALSSTKSTMSSDCCCCVGGSIMPNFAKASSSLGSSISSPVVYPIVGSNGFLKGVTTSNGGEEGNCPLPPAPSEKGEGGPFVNGPKGLLPLSVTIDAPNTAATATALMIRGVYTK